MTKLKEESTRLKTAISELENELSKYNKNDIKADINEKNKINNLLETLMEDTTIQKRYPKYNRIKKILYSIPGLAVTVLTILIILISIILRDVTFTAFASVLALAADYITYHGLLNVCDKKILENEEYKPYYDLYNDKTYSAKRTLKDIRTNEKDIEKDKALLEGITDKEAELLKLNGLLNKLNGIRDDYVEKTFDDNNYSAELSEVRTKFEEVASKPKQILKK